MTTTANNTRTEVVDAIRSALAEAIGRDQSHVTEESGIFTEIGLDSTGVLDVLMAVEEILDIELDTEELEMKDFSTVGSLTDFLLVETRR